MSLTLYRREDEALLIHLVPGADHAKVIEMLSTTGIEICVCYIKKSGVKSFWGHRHERNHGTSA